MSSDVLLEAPRPLLTLPRPPDSGQGRYHVGEVYGTTEGGGGKSRRLELAIGVDGEGISIIDIRSSTIKSSYAVSPRSFFTCPPHSIRHRASSQERDYRLTYASITKPETELVCFSSQTPGLETSSGPLKPIYSHKLQRKNVKVTLIQTLPYGETISNLGVLRDVLVLWSDGLVNCFQGDLKKERWSARILEQDAGVDGTDGNVIEFAALYDAQKLKKGMYKERQDITAILEQVAVTSAGGEDHGLPVLVTLSRGRKTNDSNKVARYFSAVAVRSATKNGFEDGRYFIQPLQTLKVGEPFDAEIDIDRVSLDTTHGELIFLSGGILRSVLLSPQASEIHTTLAIPTSSRSILSLPRSSILTASPSDVSVYDALYGSVQASTTSRISGEQRRSRKRKLEQTNSESATPAIQLVSFFSSLEIAVGISGNQVIGIGVRLPKQHIRSSKRRNATTLLSAVCRGTKRMHAEVQESPEQLPTSLDSSLLSSESSFDHAFAEKSEQLARHVQNSDVQEFDKAFFNLLGLSGAEVKSSMPESSSTKGRKRRRTEEGEQPTAVVNGVVNGASSAKTSRATRQIASSSSSRRLVEFTLSKMFTWIRETNDTDISSAHDDVGGHLKIVFYPPKAWNWILENSLFSSTDLEQALRRNPNDLEPLWRLPADAFVKSFVKFDPSFGAMQRLLRAPIYLSTHDLLQALVLLLQSDQEKEKPLQLTNGVERKQLEMPNGVSAKRNGDLTDDTTDTSVRSSPSDAPDSTFAAILVRLASVPVASISPTLRQNFPKTDIFLLLERLRLEISQSGWLQPYLTEVADSEQNDAMSVTLLGNLISAAVDSAGLGGWQLGSRTAEPMETANTVSLMRYEVSAALEGLEEAAYLEGLLRELLVYEKKLSRGGSKAQSSGAIQTQVPDEALLPLGWKDEQEISRTRVGAGGEVHTRTSRDIGRLKSMRVGKYSFEKILI